MIGDQFEFSRAYETARGVAKSIPMARRIALTQATNRLLFAFLAADQAHRAHYGLDSTEATNVVGSHVFASRLTRNQGGLSMLTATCHLRDLPVSSSGLSACQTSPPGRQGGLAQLGDAAPPTPS